MSGCYKAPSKFSLQSIRNFGSIDEFSIVGMLDVDIEASRMICSVVVGSFLFSYFFPPNISRSITANIESVIDSDLHEKLSHRFGSIWCQNHVESNLNGFFCSIFFCFLFRINSLSVQNYCWQYYMTLRHLKLDLHGVCRIGITCIDWILCTKFHRRIRSIHSKKLLPILHGVTM